MALQSPGVQVTVIDESFYTPSEPGTTPLIFVATAENKPNAAGTGIAPGTLASNAGRVYLITSQRELSETFGDAVFYTDENNNPIHGGEQNEYGLQAAYSFLGVSNSAYVVRAPIDLAAITPSAIPTSGLPAPRSYWFDTNDTRYGIFEWNSAPNTTIGGQTFTNKVPTVITDVSRVVDFTGGDFTPKGSVGAIGDYALVAVSTLNKLWYKNYQGTWVEVGTASWKDSWPVVVSENAPSVLVADDVTFQVGSSAPVTVNTGTSLSQFAANINTLMNVSGVRAEVINNRLSVFNDGSVANTLQISGDSLTIETIGLPSNNGIYAAPAVEISTHTQVPQWKSTGSPRPTGSMWVKTTTPNLGSNWLIKRYNADTALWSSVPAPLYSSNAAAIAAMDRAGGGMNLVEGDVYIQTNTGEDPDKLVNFKIYRRNASGSTVIRSDKITGIPSNTYTFSVSESVIGSATMSASVSITVTTVNDTVDSETIVEAINSAGLTNVVADVDSQNRIVITHIKGGEIKFVDDSANNIISLLFTTSGNNATANFYNGVEADEYVATLWKVLTYTASNVEPISTPDDGALWYNSIVDEVDIMIHDGFKWVGYKNLLENENTDPFGPIVSASSPTQQRNGAALVENDIWISTADIENYPQIYRRVGVGAAGSWVLVDKTDQTTENGIIFADARYNTAGSNSDLPGEIAEMLESDYVDPDAPDPALYPRGMMLWNLRRSGFNVKKFVKNYIDLDQNNERFDNESMNGYYPDRWVTVSQNNVDGSGSFGRNAQRKIVVQALQSLINENEDIRDDESRIFNLIACPGYPETIGEMISLNYDRGLTAFIIGDSPMRLRPDSTNINNWANNINQVVEDNDFGLVSRDEYLGVYYPSGFTSDNRGNNVVVPASHMVLRTFALNDQVAFPWFAPAGTRRGGVTNASAAGYITSEGEFKAISLNEGQRNILYQANVNPITFVTGSGLVIFGQKTRARNASALDRVNVARLVIFLRRQFSALAKPFLFEPNDKLTRDEMKKQMESFLAEMVGLRAIYDYIVVCDETNNTPTRIDRNELYVDVAIEPTKAVEFIYIPLRLKNTGEIAGL
jgi:hypothetical protein